jgi:hypothetical protein
MGSKERASMKYRALRAVRKFLFVFGLFLVAIATFAGGKKLIGHGPVGLPFIEFCGGLLLFGLLLLGLAMLAHRSLKRLIADDQIPERPSARFTRQMAGSTRIIRQI